MKISRPHTKRKCNSLKRKSENSDSLGYYFKKAWIGTAVSLLGSFALLIFFSALSMLSKDPAIFVFPFSFTTLLCSVLACGFITYKLCRESPVFCGLVSGAMIEIVFLIAAIFIGRKSTAFPMGLRTVMYIIIIPLSISGALIGNIKFPRKRRRSSARR